MENSARMCADFIYDCAIDHPSEAGFNPGENKKPRRRVLLIRMFTNFGRDVVFSADLCYNDMGDENG